MTSKSNLIKLKPTSQINTKADIMKEYKKINKLFKQYDRFDPDNQKLILDALRRLSNRILQLTQGYLNAEDIDKEVLRNYNRELSRLKRFAEKNKDDLLFLEKFDQSYYNDISTKNIEALKQDYLSSVTDSLKIHYINNEQAFEFIDNIKKAELKGDIKLFKPRTVLFQVGTKEKGIIDTAVKNEYRQRYNRAKRDIGSIIKRVFEKEKTLDFKKANNRIKKVLSRFYPEGKVTFPKMIKGKTTYTSISLESYADMWTKDMISIQSFKNELAIAKSGNYDLVEMVDVDADSCEVCKPLEGTYSLSGKSKTYKKLDFSLPIHTLCNHRIVISSENF